MRKNFLLFAWPLLHHQWLKESLDCPEADRPVLSVPRGGPAPTPRLFFSSPRVLGERDRVGRERGKKGGRERAREREREGGREGEIERGR